MANDMLQSLSSDVSIFSFWRNLWHGKERFDFFLSEILSEGLVDGALKSIDDT